MSFLDEFDRRAQFRDGKPPAGSDATPPEPQPELSDDDRQLLEFADMIRANQVSTPDARERVLQRVRSQQQNSASPQALPQKKSGWGWKLVGAAAIFVVTGLAYIVMNTQVAPPKPGPRSDTVADKKFILPGDYEHSDAKLIAAAPHFDAKSIQDEFSGVNFPEAVAKDDTGLETANDRTDARLLRVGGLVMLQLKNEKRWRVCARGQAVPPGATLRLSKRANAGARLLAPDGSTVTAAPGALLHYDGARAWKLDEGNAYFNVAARKDLDPFTVTTPHASPRALGTQFGLEVSAAQTVCSVDEGKVAFNADASLVCDAGKSLVLDKTGARTPDKIAPREWLSTLQSLAESDHGIGQLVAGAEKSTEMLPLEIKSHAVNVTVMDQVARTFVDMVFVNNSDRRLEGTFYYPLPADASISEFAMYVGDKRIVGEVLEQQRARQVFEYIVRQQKDPALLEYAGGNIFKMRVFPIEPKSEKRVQLGYTQILPRSGGKVTYTYPLFSEMLVKNPLHDLKIDVHVSSSNAMANFASPTHQCALASSPDNLLGSAAFHAKNYAPTRDFAITYDVANAPECAAFANQRPEDDNRYFMLQLCPAARAVKSEIEPRLLLIVDGSASNDPQEYAIATEFASASADVSRNWQFGLVRGGQTPEVFNGKMIETDATTPDKICEFLSSRPPLGATDLLATFRAAANLANGEPLRVVYIGSGIDTVSELAPSQLLNEITALFRGKNVSLSMVAVGSRYERPIMQGLAAGLGGSFARIEGADGVSDAVGRINDGFYRAALRDVRVEFENLDVNHVYPEILGTITAGDTAIVLGRVASSTSKGRVIVHADTDGQDFQRAFDIDLSANETQNRFLPRLWARAHIEALMSGLGLGDAKDDAAARNAVIETSCTYQIMSPLTAFLVLESDEDYARYGIKRTMKQWDWNGDASGIAGGTIPMGKLETLGNFQTAASAPAASRTLYDGPVSTAKPMELDDWVDSNDVSKVMVEDEKKTEKLRIDGLVHDFNREETDRDDGRYNLDSAQDFGGNIERIGDEAQYAPQFYKRSALKREYAAVDELQAGLGGKLKGNYRYKSQPFYSLVLNAGTVAVTELDIDQPLRPLAYYQRLQNAGNAEPSVLLNLSLAYEANGQFAEALTALTPVLEHFPKVAELWLQKAALAYRADEQFKKKHSLEERTPQFEVLAKQAIATALEVTAEADRPAMKVRIAQMLSGLTRQKEAAALYREVLDTPGSKIPPATVVSPLAYALAGSGDEKGCRDFLEESLKRWPTDADVRKTAAQVFATSLKDPTRGIAILRETEKLDDNGRQQLIALLLQNNNVDAAATEFNALAATAKEPNALFSALAGFYNTDRERASALALGFLDPASTPVQAAAGLQYLQSYYYGNAWSDADIKRVLATGARADLSAQGRMSAYYLLSNIASQRQVDNARFSALLEPALLKTGTKEELGQAVQALTALASLASRVHDDSVVKHARRLLESKQLDPWQRAQLIQAEYSTLQVLGRTDEANAVSDALFQSESEESVVQSTAWNLFYACQGRADFDGAARVLERFTARFSNSYTVAQIHNQLLQYARSQLSKEDFDALKARLLKAYPNTPALVGLRIKMLAERGQWKEAQEAVRAAIQALEDEHAHPKAEKEPVPTPTPAPEPKTDDEKKAMERQIERQKRSALKLKELQYEQSRVALIDMLARLCGRDADSRAAFIKEAEARIPDENPGSREWTNAILACLNSAGDVPGVVKRLEALAGTTKEANDPLWKEQLGYAYLSARKWKEARETLTPIAQAHPEEFELALTLRGICAMLKDEKSAEDWLTRAIDAMAADPNQLSQYGYQWQQSHAEWALRAWKRYAEVAPEGQKSSGLYQAAMLAMGQGKEDEALQLHFDALAFKNESSYANSSMQQLVGLAQKEEHLRAIEKRLSQVTADSVLPSQAAFFELLRFRIGKLKNAADAGTHLKLAASIEGVDQTAMSEIANALAGDGQFEAAAQYATTGGGKIQEEQRRQTIRNLTYQLRSDTARPLQERLLRQLVAKPDQNTPNDQQQLVECLTTSGKLAEAETEVRAMKPVQNNDWALHSAWTNLINVHLNQQHFSAALALAKEFVERERDSTQLADAVSTYSRVGVEAARQRQLNSADREALKTVIVDACKRYLERPVNSPPWTFAYKLDLINVAGIQTRAELDPVAHAAAGSEDLDRVRAGAQYFADSDRRAEALKIYQRELTLKGVDERSTYASMYALYTQNTPAPADWGSALDVLEKLRALKYSDDNWYLHARVQCLYGLKRTTEAREAARKLIELRTFQRQGYWSAQSLAYECQQAQDWTMATEAWELALRLIRRQQGQLDSNTAAQFYTNCAQAYAQAGETQKSIDCFLRGMSLIPRSDVAYKGLLDAALKTVLNGGTLDAAVDAYAKQLSAPGGGEKPQLRIAFAEAYNRAGNPVKRLEQLKIAADLLPHDTDLRKQLIDGYLARRDTDAALAAYFSWAKLDPQNIDVYRGMGELYEKLGRPADALLAWSTMAQVRPREAEGYRAYAQKLAQTGKPDKAAVALRQAVKYRPTEFDVASELAAVYSTLSQTGKIPALWTEGEAACRQAIENLADDPSPWLNLGRFLEAENRRADARKLYESIVARPWPRFQNDTYTRARERLTKL